MGKIAGGALRLTSTFFYFLEFCCAGVGLAIFSYFLAKLSYHDLAIAQRWRAVEGITGSAVLYTIFAVILTCFLGGVRIFGFLAILLNIAFCGGMVAVAVLTRDGADSCSGVVNTPLGYAPVGFDVAGTNQHTACIMNKTVFAVSIIAAFLFLVSAVLQIFIVRHHQKEKKYGPSPANNYTSGSGSRKFWRRNKQTNLVKDASYTNGHNAELGTVGAGAPVHGRHSQETGYTGTTVSQNDAYGTAKYDTAPVNGHVDSTPHSGYHTGPTGTSVNPYGYQNNTTTGTNY